jgi:hypothetical protein
MIKNTNQQMLTIGELNAYYAQQKKASPEQKKFAGGISAANIEPVYDVNGNLGLETSAFNLTFSRESLTIATILADKKPVAVMQPEDYELMNRVQTAIKSQNQNLKQTVTIDQQFGLYDVEPYLKHTDEYKKIYRL